MNSIDGNRETGHGGAERGSFIRSSRRRREEAIAKWTVSKKDGLTGEEPPAPPADLHQWDERDPKTQHLGY